MSGGSPFARGLLAHDIGLGGQEEVVEKMIKGTYVMDATWPDEVHASNEIQCFLKAPQLPNSKGRGDTVPVMHDAVNLEEYIEVFNKQKNQQRHLHLVITMGTIKRHVKVNWWQRSI